MIHSARSSAQFYSRFRDRNMPTMRYKGAIDALVAGPIKLISRDSHLVRSERDFFFTSF